MSLVKEEILVRLKMLQDLHGLLEDTYEAYNAREEIYVSGRFNVYGKLELGCVPAEHLKLIDTPLLNFVKDFETEHKGCKVFHIILGYGPFINLLYVGSYMEEWEYERPNKYNVQSYVINLAIPEYSEFGRIAIKGDKGVLIRTE